MTHYLKVDTAEPQSEALQIYLAANKIKQFLIFNFAGKAAFDNTIYQGSKEALEHFVADWFPSGCIEQDEELQASIVPAFNDLPETQENDWIEYPYKMRGHDKDSWKPLTEAALLDMSWGKQTINRLETMPFWADRIAVYAKTTADEQKLFLEQAEADEVDARELYDREDTDLARINER